MLSNFCLLNLLKLICSPNRQLSYQSYANITQKCFDPNKKPGYYPASWMVDQGVETRHMFNMPSMAIKINIENTNISKRNVSSFQDFEHSTNYQ